jgi:hypothetical protein
MVKNKFKIYLRYHQYSYCAPLFYFFVKKIPVQMKKTTPEEAVKII